MGTKQVVSIISYILAGILVCLVLYGSYRWYFKRPPTTVYQNTYQNYTIMPGANQTVENYKPVEKPKRFGGFFGVWGGTTSSSPAIGLVGGITW